MLRVSITSLNTFSSPWLSTVECGAYLFEVGGLVEQLEDLLGLLVVGLGPGAGFLFSVNHLAISKL